MSNKTFLYVFGNGIMKIKPDCIYMSYSLRGHARHQYIYTWEEDGEIKANNTYFHNNFAKMFGSYEYGYDVEKLEKIDDLQFIGEIDDFELIGTRSIKNYKEEDVLEIPIGMGNSKTYIKKNAELSKDIILEVMKGRKKDNEYKVKRAKEELDYINQYLNLIGTDDEYLIYGYEDSDVLFRPQILKELSSHEELLKYKK